MAALFHIDKSQSKHKLKRDEVKHLYQLCVRL
jgi:hypothetical protein